MPECPEWIAQGKGTVDRLAWGKRPHTSLPTDALAQSCIRDIAAFLLPPFGASCPNREPSILLPCCRKRENSRPALEMYPFGSFQKMNLRAASYSSKSSHRGRSSSGLRRRIRAGFSSTKRAGFRLAISRPRSRLFLNLTKTLNVTCRGDKRAYAACVVVLPHHRLPGRNPRGPRVNPP